MGVPLEYRSPFLDYRMVEFGFTLPLGYLIRDGWMKWIVRKAMEPYLPQDILWRRQKGGFRYPLGERLPDCRAAFLELLRDADCPYVDFERLAGGYTELNRRDPNYLWRLISVGLWWKRCVKGERLRSDRADRRAAELAARNEFVGAGG
jgi:asparagine synthase (glutamine-hydrolysing)